MLTVSWHVSLSGHDDVALFDMTSAANETESTQKSIISLCRMGQKNGPV